MTQHARRLTMEAIVSFLIVLGITVGLVAFGRWFSVANDLAELNVDVLHVVFYRITQTLGEFHGQIVLGGLSVIWLSGTLLFLGLMEAWHHLTR